MKKYAHITTAALLAVWLANAVASDGQKAPSDKLLQQVAKIDACAMALDPIDKKLSQALQIKAEILMNPYYTDELDAMDDKRYNQIPWVKTYNAYFLDEQREFFQLGAPEFAKDAAKARYQKQCITLAKEVL